LSAFFSPSGLVPVSAFLVLSAGAGMESRLAALAPDAFLPKPFELDHLLHTVARVCRRHGGTLSAPSAMHQSA